MTTARFRAAVCLGLCWSLISGLGNLPLPLGQIQIAAAQPSTRRVTSRRRKPPDKGVFVPFGGGGSRGCGEQMLPLVPREASQNNSGGLTMSARPDFWFFVPHTAKELNALSFTLNRSSDYEPVYQVALNFPEQPGFVQIKFPEGAPDLEIGVGYNWVIEANIKCLPKVEDLVQKPLTQTAKKPTSAEKPASAEKITGSENQLTGIDQMQGWVERYQPDAELQQMLKTLPPQQTYQAAGIWIDALNLLMTQRQTQADTPELRQAWSKLLEVYELESLADKDFADCCAYAASPILSDEQP